mgnify:CR=1 FL=1|tara:strand:- start:12508 stop:13041 length:534 start_codon:yes stop_codon:yes gene_type:complete
MYIYIVLILALASNWLVGYYVTTKRGQNNDGKVRDVGFELLPDLGRYEILHDLTGIIPTLFLLYNWFSAGGWSAAVKHRYMMTLTFMYAARAMTNIVTQFPAAKPGTCTPNPPFSFCNDYMFSGHTTFNIVTSYFVGKVLYPVYPIIASLVTIATREHYSVDVLVAWIIFFAVQCRI